LAAYQREKEIEKTLKNNYDEKVAKLNELLSSLFSDNAINTIRPLIASRKYPEALEQLKKTIFKGTIEEANYLRGILDKTTYNQEMNFPIFITSLGLIHEMLQECDITKTDAEKKSDLESMIKRGDCQDFKETIKSLKNTEQPEKRRGHSVNQMNVSKNTTSTFQKQNVESVESITLGNVTQTNASVKINL
jgi:hypothetical protein